MNNNICAFDQSGYHVLARGALQINGDTALVAIEVGKPRADVRTRSRPHCAKPITLERLNLDDISTKVAEKLAGIGA